MNKKPIKRNENILKLSKEHHFSLLFCWKIRQGLKTRIEPGRIIEYVKYFHKNFLQPHFTEEEDILFVLLNNKPVTKAIEQHKQINDLLSHLSDNTKDNANAQLARLADMVDDHVRYEERELFPHMEKALSKEQLESVGKQLHSEHPPLKDEYIDEFWIKR